MACLDAFNRPISYLRVSVTNRCNLRCIYCMPREGISWQPHGDVLRYEEIRTVVRAAAEIGINKVRLTGGEPLVRRDVVELVRMIARIPGIDDLAMTTNGTLLARYADDLKAAGLQRVNVSLDSLRPERFRRITRLGELSDTLEGIAAAKEAGLVPVKINTVVMRGLNDDEVLDFTRRTYSPDWHVRFIELMPFELCHSRPVANRPVSGLSQSTMPEFEFDWRAGYAPMEEVRRRIERELGEILPAKMRGSGPARYYRLSGAEGTIGFITPVSEHFCYQCNRLRLTADGHLRPCLLSDYEIDLRTPLRQGVTVKEIKHLIVEAVRAKPKRHHLDEELAPPGRTMSQIGG